MRIVTTADPESPPTANLMPSIADLERETGVVRAPRPGAIDPELREAIARAPWKATTYVAPHEYVMEHWSPECRVLVAAVRTLIHDHGYYREFRGKRFPTVHLDEHYYWQMPGSECWPIAVQDRGHSSPICLNRAKLPVAE